MDGYSFELISLLNLVYHILAASDLSEHGVLAVQPIGGDMRDEKLAAIRVGPRIRHRQEARLVELAAALELVLELVQVGIGLRKAESLVKAFPESRIRKQLGWLPLRAARRPASLLIAAIEHDYDAPVYADAK